MSFFKEESDFVYCNDVQGLMMAMGATYVANEWRLCIDSSNASLKDIFLHNGNTYASLPVAHSVVSKRIGVCDFELFNFILGQQSGYTKFPCFLCVVNGTVEPE